MIDKKKIIIDCDPGQDDAIALLLTFSAYDSIELLGITTVAGNVQLKKTQRNARLICEMLGQTNIPVYAGCERPLFRPLVTAEEYHGIDGLNGIEIYEPQMPLQKKNAVQYLIETLDESEINSVTLVGIGPLTNIGMMLIQAPRVKNKIKEIVIMGGSYFEGGNVTAAAEFNFYVDPHAADIVFKSGCPITVFGLDATHQARVSKTLRNRMDEYQNTTAMDILKSSVDYFQKAYKDIYDQDDPPIHDVLTIAYLINPDLFSGVDCNILIETNSELTMGASVVDVWNLTNEIKNAKWINSVEQGAFFEMLLKGISSL